jgi:hypothetical protein
VDHREGGSSYLFRVLCVVQAQTSNGLDIFKRKRRQEQPDIFDLVCHLMVGKDVAKNDSCLSCLSYVRNPLGQDGIAVEDFATL